jgi:hypothetical protein
MLPIYPLTLFCTGEIGRKAALLQTLHSSKKGHQGITLVTIILCIKELTEYPYQ